MLTSSCAVRLAVPEDVPALITLMRALAVFEDYIDEFKVDAQALLDRAFGPQAQCQIFVAEWDACVAGYAVVLEIPYTYDLRPTILLKELYVSDACRGRGLGHALLQHVARVALDKGAARIKWDVMVGNDPAEAFYQALGGHRDSKWIPYQMGIREIEMLATSMDRKASELCD
ncbi:GNAT family N-acetyltransferase [Pseudomonas sp. v388]|uniref:GNAT family N-acetyltransferase n=1 Tax=Pseudomonas sp. v388 TaxID=2479849 RepID=UPI000F76700C|nr:GNAT family N-acetyltransferase [Pseudomonas sp. v388]RRV10574.1 GNAT family N-acetyltransferase [Pseudomonas sp. v388]